MKGQMENEGEAPIKFRQIVPVGPDTYYLITENGDLVFMRSSQYERDIAKIIPVKIEMIE